MDRKPSDPTAMRNEIFSSLDQVPSISSAAVELLDQLRDPDTPAPRLASVIEHDPGLAASVLRLANSAQFGGVRSISSLREAVVRLGARNLHRVVMSAVAGELAPGGIPGYGLRPGAFQNHSAMVAAGAEALADILKIDPGPTLFTAALLHDVGKFVLNTYIPLGSGKVGELAYDGSLPFEQAERAVLGTDHAEVGAELLDRWNLPEELISLVRWHHQPDAIPEPNPSADIIHVADMLSLMSGFGAGSDGVNYHTSQAALDRLGVTRRIGDQVTSRMCIAGEELSRLLSNK